MSKITQELIVANLSQHLNRWGGAKSWQIVDKLELGGEE
jgi:hypothetical protein